MAAHIVVLYNAPTDPQAFEAYYMGTHVPIAKKIPGLGKYTITRGAVGAAGGTSPYYMIADLEFESMDAIQKALTSPEGTAAAQDVPNFATGGATILMHEVQEL
jgi:uncharacterized protein (TIGR02118 family)